MIAAFVGVAAVVAAWTIGRYMAPAEVKHHLIRIPVSREDKLFTTADIAGGVDELTPRDVRRDIEDGRLEARKIGNTWVIREREATRYMKSLLRVTLQEVENNE